MPLQCPQCQSSILAQQIDQQLQASCSQCNTVFDAADRLAGLLAYQHPKKIAPTPANVDETFTNGILEITLGRFRKRWQQWLAWGVVYLLPFSLPLLLFVVSEAALDEFSSCLGVSMGLLWSVLIIGASVFLRKITITATKSSLTITMPNVKFNKQFATRDIKQLYLKRSAYSFPTPEGIGFHYELWTLLQGGQTEPLITDLKDWPTALYLEQRLEAALKLKDQPVEGELDYLSPDEYRQLLEWGTLAERLNLAFIPDTDGGYYEGYYPNKASPSRSHFFQLDAFYQRYREKFTRYTRLRLLKANLVPAQLSPEEEAELKNRLARGESIDLLAPPGAPKELKGTLEVRPGERIIYYEQVGIEADLVYLEKLFELMSYIAEVYPKILTWGGAAVPALRAVATQDPSLKGVARQLLQDIAAETQTRLGKQGEQLLCPSCLQACTTHKIWLPPGEPLIYYGCRACRQSREFLVAKGSIIAVLDEQMAQPYQQQDESLYINWLHYRHLFDFDEIHIRQVNDQEVERFAIQAGNDTDNVRQPRYIKMRCLVWPDAGLSENSLKVLKRTFGHVEVKAQDRRELQGKAETSGSRASRFGSEMEEGIAKDTQETY